MNHLCCHNLWVFKVYKVFDLIMLSPLGEGIILTISIRRGVCFRCTEESLAAMVSRKKKNRRMEDGYDYEVMVAI